MSALLARVAEHLYWIGRYTERVEGTARVVANHGSLFCDIPVASGVDWSPMLAITGSGSRFEIAYADTVASSPSSEVEVVRFLVLERENPSSLVRTLAAARNNMRTCRERLPREAWEVMNRLYLYASEEAGYAVAAGSHTAGSHTEDRSMRFRYLSHLVLESQKLTGILNGTMSRDPAYAFLMLGQNLERADMTTRVLDVHAELLGLRAQEERVPFEDVLWRYALKSLAADQMFRRTTASGAVGFLLRDHRFPRAVAFCLDEVTDRLKALPSADEALAATDDARRFAHEDLPEPLAGESLHAYVDELQQRLDGIHDAITRAWLRPDLPTTLSPAVAETPA